MISAIFRTIGIIGCFYYPKTIKIYNILYQWLHNHGFIIMIENNAAALLHVENNVTIGDLHNIGKRADLAIVIGGDGSMLRAASILMQYDIKIIGINFGTLGFLTDLHPNSALITLADILAGNFINEKRFLLNVIIQHNNSLIKLGTAINEVVLHANTIRKMIEFELYIDNVFIFSLRSDGLIIATPTGSTAYSLAAGGPILSPTVNAFVLVPICPHTVSYRPIVIDSKSIISLKFSKITSKLNIGCDNQTPLIICGEEEILIQRSKYYLNLIHPNNYNYFKNLNIKLGWLKSIN